MASKWVWIGALGAGGLAAALANGPKPAYAATAPPLVGPAAGEDPATAAPEPASPPAAFVAPAQGWQSRPILRADQIVNPQQVSDIVAVAQAQLNALGYGPLAVDGVNGRHTKSAAARFDADHQGAVAAYEASVGNDRAVLYAIDDAWRARNGAAQAPDHVAPSGDLVRASAGLSFCRRHAA